MPAPSRDHHVEVSIRGPHISAPHTIVYWSNGVSRKTTLLHATLYLVLGFRHQSNVRKHESNITDGVRKRSSTKWGVRPIDPDTIKGVTIATRAGPFRPLLNEHSGKGTSQPCDLHKTEAAALAIQPPGATWRHYNPERGERVVRKAVLARYEPVTWIQTHDKAHSGPAKPTMKAGNGATMQHCWTSPEGG